MNDFLIIGKFIGAHGVKGEVKIFPITDDVRRFHSLTRAILLDAAEKKVKDLTVTGRRQTNDRVLLTIEGITNRDEAAKLNGFYLAVSRENAAKLPEGRYFISDMLGCRVFDQAHGMIGTVKDIFPTGANDVIAVKREGKQDLYIPFLSSAVTEVDLPAQSIQVILPDGLWEVYEA